MSNTITINQDRLDEIEDFISALDEWGCLDHESRQEHILTFLKSPIGLTQYLERETAPVIGHA